jgi:hypothetical protein
MRNDDPIEDTGNLLTDLWRNTSPIVRTGLFGGLGVGLLAGTYFGLMFLAELSAPSSVGVRRGVLWPSLCTLFGLTAAGGFVGLFLGVVVELVVDKIRGPQDKKPKKRRRP